MAKYDTHKIVVVAGREGNQYTLELTVLFEDGDDISQVLTQASNDIKSEAERMNNSDFLKDVEP